MTGPLSTLGGRTRSNVESVGRRLPLDRRDRRWLALCALAAALAVAVYLLTNRYPASGGGLYLKIARETAANGFVPPATVPGYTADGVPFSYQPLQFYVLATLLEFGVDPLLAFRVGPGVAVVAATVPIYLLARDVSDSRPVGALAAASVALNPQILQWHVTAGGFVRAYAFLYALIAIYAGYRVFDGGRRRAVVVGLLAFGATALAHPTYALFVVASYVLFWAVLDGSVPGLARGAVVGVGGALLASPWLVWVVLTHGGDVFVAAAGTHGGIGGGLDALAGDVSPVLAGPLVGAAYLAYRREYLLPAWFVAAELLFAQPRFSYTVGAIVVPVAGLAVVRDLEVLDRFDDATEGFWTGRVSDPRAAAAIALLIAGAICGGAYLGYEMSLASDPSTPEYLDDDAVKAMEWVAAETDPDDRFVVLGDAAEWFPALTDRTILVGPWGVEWVSADEFDRQIEAFEGVSNCRSGTCVEGVADAMGHRPEYVYVPKGQYTVRGHHEVQFGTIERSFDAADRWERAHENDGVVVYRRGAGD